jgi:hypothetical protein
VICPHCRQFNDDALSPSGRLPPKDFDPIVCVGCHTILAIDHTWPGGCRPPDDTDLAAWNADRRLTRALAPYRPREEPDP